MSPAQTGIQLVTPATGQGAAVAGVVVLALLFMGGTLNVRWLIWWKRNPGWPRRAFRRLRHRPWTGHNAAGIFAVAALLYAAATLGGLALHQAGSMPGSPLVTAIVMTAVLHLGIVAAVLMGVRRERIAWRAAFGRPRALRREGTIAAAGYAAMLPAVFLLTLLAHAALRAANIPPRPQAVLTVFMGGGIPLWLRVLLMLTAVITAPLAEELLFRGILLPVLLKHWGTVVAILLSSALFAVLHGNLTAFLPLMAAATAFAAGYAATGSIWTPVLMHALFNAASLALLLAAGGLPV